MTEDGATERASVFETFRRHVDPGKVAVFEQYGMRRYWRTRERRAQMPF